MFGSHLGYNRHRYFSQDKNHATYHNKYSSMWRQASYSLLAYGLSFDQILEEMPDLEREDSVAAIQFASRHALHD